MFFSFLFLFNFLFRFVFISISFVWCSLCFIFYYFSTLLMDTIAGLIDEMMSRLLLFSSGLL